MTLYRGVASSAACFAVPRLFLFEPMPATQTLPHDTRKDIVLRPSQFRLFRELVYRTTGISLADNKLEFVQSRLRKRLRHCQLDSYGAYYDLLENDDPDGSELQEMINRITTNKTNFFREEHHFDYLSEVVFPRLIEEAERGQRPRKLRIWCAASSTGEEPYSLAVTVQNTFADLPGWDIRILASDIDTNVLETARSAIYIEERVEDLPTETLKKHFFRGNGPSAGKVMVRPETGQLVTFRQINLLDSEWPIRTQFDVIFCRNVLIYFDQPTHDSLMQKMAQFLTPDGSLFIGHSESLSRLSDTWIRVDKTVYQRTNAGAVQEPPHCISTPQQPPVTLPRTEDDTQRREQHTGNDGGSGQQENHPQQALISHAGVKPTRRSIIVGDVVASDMPTEISTVLGSCIAVCLFDENRQLGGMNHFALPVGSSCARTTASFGVHAMELLINQIMQLGGDRRCLQAKVFGGANVLKSTDQNTIGQRNADFIREFLSTESIPIVSEYIGGDCGMQVLFETHTGRARLKLLDREKALEADRQIDTAKSQSAPEPVTDITLF